MTSLSISTPPTSHVMRSPRPTSRSLAISISSETGVTAASGGAVPWKVPATSVSVSVSAERMVERYSRRSVQRSGPPSVPANDESAEARRASTGTPRIAAMRIWTSGT